MLLKEIHLTYPLLEKLKYVEPASNFSNPNLFERSLIDGYYDYNYVFRMQTRCICAHVEYYWKPKVKWDFWKIVINCSQKNEENNITNFSDIYIAKCCLDYKEYFNLDNCEKKKLILNIIEQTISEILLKNNLETDSFRNACEKVRQDNYLKQLIVTKKKSPEGLKAEIWGVHDINQYQLLFVVKDKKQILTKQLIETSLPDEFCFAPLGGTLSWVAERKVEYHSKQNRLYSMDIDNSFYITKQQLPSDFYGKKDFDKEIKKRLDIISSVPNYNNMTTKVRWDKNIDSVSHRFIFHKKYKMKLN